jgi:hypothetical protein
MWDEEVDAAARAVTEGGVLVDFRSRVLARIDARSRRSAWKPVVLSSVAAAALVLVLAILIVSSRERRAPTASQPSPAVASESTRSARIDIPVAPRESGRFVRMRSDVRTDLSRDLPSSAGGASAIEDLDVPLLAPQQRIENDPLTTDRLVTEPITIDALELPPLDGQTASQ